MFTGYKRNYNSALGARVPYSYMNYTMGWKTGVQLPIAVRKDLLFAIASRLALGPTQYPIQRLLGLFFRV
jgi:hypothetical protein